MERNFMEIYDTQKQNNTDAFFRLVETMKRAKANKRPFCLFIGAGCSLSSSLTHSITTEQIIKDCLIRSSSPDYEIPSSWECLYRDFVNNVWHCLANEDRREMLFDCFDNLVPSKGYKYLKTLVENGYIQYIITTNFDMLIDTILIDIPHKVYVSNLPVRNIKNGSNIELIKVHGDIENGNLRFSPDELFELPESISSKIRDRSHCNCLVCGYRGQDTGVMKSLSMESEYTSFWASPRRPSEINHFETHHIYNWMNSRNSNNNFIYGDILGNFDTLMQKLAESLLGAESRSFLPNYWENNLIANSMQVNEKIVNIFCNIVNCSDVISEEYNWQPMYPFYAENYKSVLNAYLQFYKTKVGKTLKALQIPENEVEALLLGVAIEIVTRTSGLQISAVDYAKKIKNLYNEHNYHYSPDESFWDALFIILSALVDLPDKKVWEEVEHIRLNMNSGGRFYLNVKKPMLHKMYTILNILNLCGILHPTSIDREYDDIKLHYKKVLENKSHYIDIENNKLILHLDNITKQEYDHIYSIFFETHQAIISGSAFVSSPTLLPDVDVLSNCSNTYNVNFSEYIYNKSNFLTTNFLKLRTAFEFDSEKYVKTPTDDAILNFLNSSKAGMFLIGSSGSGKTKTIQHFCEKNQDNYVIAATSPKCNSYDCDNGIGIFFRDILDNHIYNQKQILEMINQVLSSSQRKLILIFDGLNEISSDTEVCVTHYKNLLSLIELISVNKIYNCKVIVTCRDIAFLDYCNNCGLYPLPEYCYCNTNANSSVPYYQIQPLSLELQIEFCKTYIRNINQQEAFITDLKNNRFIQSSFTHPYLIAIAGSCYEKTTSDITLLVSNVFAQFTRQMLKRLTFKDDVVLAQKVINTYCSLLISSQSPTPKITTFLLLNSEELYEHRLIYSRILKELQDINLFTKEDSSDRIRISHDRIEEYIISDFLYHSFEPQVYVNRVVSLATTDSIFSCALQSYFDRCIINSQYADILDNLIVWYNINPQLVPLLFVCAVGHLKPDDLRDLMVRILYNYKNPKETIEIIILGLKQALSFGQLDYPYNIFDTLDSITSDTMVFSNYKAHWKYIASKYYSKFQNDHNKALAFCNEALKFCEPDSNMYHIISLQLSILQTNYTNDTVTLDTFENLYKYFRDRNEIEYATECILHWGSFLRKCSKFEEAICVYQKINPDELLSYPQLCSSLLRKIGTAHKNIVQRFLRELKEIKDLSREELESLYAHYNSAINSFQTSKIYLKNTISVEMLSLLSEITETAIIVVPIMKEQRYYADVYLAEEEKQLSYIPLPEQEVLFMRNKARLLEYDGNYTEAMETLVAAKKYAFDTTMAFRLFEINYQLCRLTMRQWEHLNNDERQIGIEAMNVALSYPLDKNNEYYKVLIKTKDIIDKKMF